MRQHYKMSSMLQPDAIVIVGSDVKTEQTVTAKIFQLFFSKLQEVNYSNWCSDACDTYYWWDGVHRRLRGYVTGQGRFWGADSSNTGWVSEFICSIWLIWTSSWENLLLPYANKNGADQPAHPRMLISAFVVRCLEGIISLVSISKISRLS